MTLRLRLLGKREIIYFAKALGEIIANYKDWGRDYVYNKKVNEFQNGKELERVKMEVLKWFE